MDTDYQFQPISSKRQGQPPQSFPQISTVASEDSEQQTLDLAWLFAVVRRRAPIMAAVAIALSAVAGSSLVWTSKQIIPVYAGKFRVLVEPVTAEGRLARLSLQAQSSSNSGVADLSKIGSSVEDTSLLDYETQIRVLKSPESLAPILIKLQEKYKEINYNSLVNNLSISRINYEKAGKEVGTKLLDFTYQDEDKKKVIFVLETIKDSYLEYSRQERMTGIKQVIDFIESQLPELRRRVDTLQAQLERLRQQSNMTTPELASRGLADRYTSLQSRQADIQSQLAETRSFYQNLKKQLNNGNTAWLATVNPKAYESLIGNLNEIESQIAINSSLFRADSPPMLSLQEKQQNLQLLLRQQAESALENVAGQIRQLEAREQVIIQDQNLVNQEIREFPVVMRKYDDIQRELEVATDSLKQFLEKREAFQLDAAQQQVPWRIIAQPDIVRDVDGKPVSIIVKQTSRQLGIAVILSILLGIGAGFLAEVLNTVFHTPEEAKGATKLPLLGVIPLSKGFHKTDRVAETVGLTQRTSRTLTLGNSSRTQQESDSTVLEAFRYLYTNIRLLSPQAPIRSLAIGSAEQGDGKSTVAIHLAQTAAAIGQRVLLVDADLRNPQLHHRLGVPNTRGLSDAIAKDIGLNDIIQRARNPLTEEFSAEDNLFVLTAGSIPNDPIKLLSSKKMLYLMEQFQAFFDLVIYDTPPIVGLADSNILGAHTDGTVLVVKIDKTDRSMLLKALDGLKISGASVLGIVANGVKEYAPSAYVSNNRR